MVPTVGVRVPLAEAIETALPPLPCLLPASDSGGGSWELWLISELADGGPDRLSRSLWLAFGIWFAFWLFFSGGWPQPAVEELLAISFCVGDCVSTGEF